MNGWPGLVGLVMFVVALAGVLVLVAYYGGPKDPRS